MRRVIVLRPEPGATATVERAKALGLDAVAIPLFEIEPIAWTAPEPNGFDGLLLTSANAVRHAGSQLQVLRGLKVYAVGEATAKAAREAGFEVAAVSAGGIEQLLSSIDRATRLLHLCGEDRVDAGAERYIAAVPVYRARRTEHPDLNGIEGGVALIHSPRAGRRFAELVEDRAGIAVAAISAAAAEALGAGWEAAAIADRPTDEAVLALAARLCNTSPPQ